MTRACIRPTPVMSAVTPHGDNRARSRTAIDLPTPATLAIIAASLAFIIACNAIGEARAPAPQPLPLPTFELVDDVQLPTLSTTSARGRSRPLP